MDEDISQTANLRVASLRALQPPSCVFEELPGDMGVYGQVIDTRQAVSNMLLGADDRLLVIVGLKRGSTDEAAINLLSDALSSLARNHAAELVVAISADATMNMDPSMDGSFHINRGINQARMQVMELNRKGLPTALEFRDTITPQFFCDLLSWASVAGQNESLQELVSGLSMPVGVRAPATGYETAIKAIETSCGPHHFLGVSAEGVCGVVKSTGNPDVIAVLGAGQGEGATAESLSEAIASVHRQRPTTSIMAELGPETLSGCASIEEGVASFCKSSVCAGGSLGTKIIGLHLRVHTENATAKTLSGVLSKLAAAVTERRRNRTLRRPNSAAQGTETDNLRIADVRPLLPPACLLEELPRDNQAAENIIKSRTAISEILHGADDRLLVLAGPAVVDDPSAALEYGARLAGLANEVSEDLLIVMTTEINDTVTPTGSQWPGLLFDPAKDGSYKINAGIRSSRELLLQLTQLGLPTALEFRETITPQFFADLLSFSSVNAQSETLAELVSGLSMPAGLHAHVPGTNGDDDAQKATEALTAAGTARHFLGVTAHGLAGIVESTGNADCALVLGGGLGNPASRAKAILEACKAEDASPVVVSTGTGGAIDADQITLARVVASAVASGQPAPKGVALNSYLLAGAQARGSDATAIRGLSVTAPCMDWLSTDALVRELAAAVRQRRASAGGAKRARRE